MTPEEKAQEQAAFEHYMMVFTQREAAWRESVILWRQYVITASSQVLRKHDAAMEHHWELADREKEVYEEWQRIAYPLNGFPLGSEKQAS